MFGASQRKLISETNVHLSERSKELRSGRSSVSCKSSNLLVDTFKRRGRKFFLSREARRRATPALHGGCRRAAANAATAAAPPNRGHWPPGVSESPLVQKREGRAKTSPSPVSIFFPNIGSPDWGVWLLLCHLCRLWLLTATRTR